MKNLIHFIALFLGTYSFSQSYWQQEVNYTISVKLDDNKHTLSGLESFEYINNSPNSLDTIYIHIWPNAYRNGETALGKQLYKNNQTELQFGNDENKGYIDSLDFKVNGEVVRWEYDKKHIDICYLVLNQPLAPGKQLTVTTPFHVKIPSGEISRLGHIEQSYQITQWYPKPAVYDKNGWNPIPYLNQGEFYSEYGSYDVSITLPENYVVGATGDLQTASEIDFMNAKASETLKKLPEFTDVENDKRDYKFWHSPESASKMKTIRFLQKNVHDFAWFADKRYLVLKGEVELPHSKRTVTSWALFTPQNAKLWQHAIEYINDGTYYYSLWNGDYPYNQVTAVDGTISAGGGMEYPNVTVIGNVGTDQDLEIVIVHEVGHNWFYGILGSNERVHGWMDEGMNTLNEMRYMQTKYPDNSYLSNMLLGGAFHFNDLDHHDSGDFSYRLIAGLGEDEPIETHSADFSSINYGIIMYQKTGLVFHYLKDYLGDEKFNQVMQTYFDTWKFKHPQPEDMKKVCEDVTGEDLSWLFNDLIQTTNHIDYKITKVKKTESGTEVTVKNKGQVSGPIGVDLISNDIVLESQWSKAYTKKATLQFNTTDFDWASIDSKHNIPEINRANNNWHSKGLLKKLEPIKMEFLIGDKESNKTNLFWTPIVAGNVYDKFMIGAAIHNLGIPFNKWQYLIAPMYSFGRNGVSGIGELSYTVLPKYNFKSIRFGISVKTFKEDSSSLHPKSHGTFQAYSPYIYAKLGNRKNSPFNQFLTLQGILKNSYNGTYNHEYKGVFLKYEAKLTYPDHQISFELRPELIEGVDLNMKRITTSANYRLKYLRNNMERWIELRVFAGKMNLNNYISPFWGQYAYAMSLSGTDGAQDLFFEDYYFGRGQMNGMWSQQRAENMGGFKSTSIFGTTEDWMLSTNILFQLPIPSFSILYGFADAGIFDDKSTSDTQYAINTGLALRISNVFGLYFPLWMSEDLNNSYSGTNYAERIRFTLKLNLVNKGSFVSSIFK
jgi:hypothetical protein